MAGRDLAIDLGTGDGAWVYRHARAEPQVFFVGVDNNADKLAEISRKAARKPDRGGATNALFVRASAEALPAELAGLAASVTVLLPWGSLLRAVIEPDVSVVAGIRKLCRPGGRLRVVSGEPVRRSVVAGYQAAGFAAVVKAITAAEVRALHTTWASRLAFGRPRVFTQIAATASAWLMQ
jgi:SAM-dependent methyltransferase